MGREPVSAVLHGQAALTPSSSLPTSPPLFVSLTLYTSRTSYSLCLSFSSSLSRAYSLACCSPVSLMLWYAPLPHYPLLTHKCARTPPPLAVEADGPHVRTFAHALARVLADTLLEASTCICEHTPSLSPSEAPQTLHARPHSSIHQKIKSQRTIRHTCTCTHADHNSSCALTCSRLCASAACLGQRGRGILDLAGLFSGKAMIPGRSQPLPIALTRLLHPCPVWKPHGFRMKEIPSTGHCLHTLGIGPSFDCMSPAHARQANETGPLTPALLGLPFFWHKGSHPSLVAPEVAQHT